MPIEQRDPDKPNFGLVVVGFCATILIVLVLAYLFVDFDGKHLTFRPHARGFGSSLIVPATPMQRASIGTGTVSLRRA